jgi:hypothetical protein
MAFLTIKALSRALSLQFAPFSALQILSLEDPERP